MFDNFLGGYAAGSSAWASGDRARRRGVDRRRGRADGSGSSHVGEGHSHAGVDRVEGDRAVVLLLASVFVVGPDLALNVVAVVLGAYGLFFAMSEILFLIAPPPPEAERVPLQKRVRPRAATVAGGALVALLVMVIVLWLAATARSSAPADPSRHATGTRSCAIASPARSRSRARTARCRPRTPTSSPPTRKPRSRTSSTPESEVLLDAYYGIKRSSGPVLTDLSASRTGPRPTRRSSEQFGKRRGEAGPGHPAAGGRQRRGGGALTSPHRPRAGLD